MKAYPLKFRPIYKERIWGGRRLAEFFGKNLPAGEKIGESWELSDLPEDKSVIINGELAGLTLEQAIKKYPKEITGDANFKLPFPLLIKFINAEDILSVQVHPDEQTSKRMGKGEPKTECWYIIDAQPNSFIYKGLKEGVTREQFAKAIKEGTVVRPLRHGSTGSPRVAQGEQAHHIVEELLQKVYVKAGECYYLPAGTVHSMGPGLIVAEVQTPSDTTYRVYDFNRLDEKGRSRQLHIDEATESIHFEKQDKPTVTTDGVLIDSKYFKVEKVQKSKGSELPIAKGEMRILIIIKGAIEIEGSGGEMTDFKGGDCLLVPASLGGKIIFRQEAEYLEVSI